VRDITLQRWKNAVEPFVAKLKSCDFDEMSAAMQGWDQEYRQLQSGPFYGELLISQIGGLQISSGRYERSLLYRGTAPADTVAIAVTLNQRGEGRWLGVQTDTTAAIVQKCGAEGELITPESWEALILSIPTQEFTRLAGELAALDPEAVPDLLGTVRLTPEACSRIRLIGLAYCAQLEASLVHSAAAAMVPQMARSLVSMLVGELVASWHLRFEKPDLVRRRQIVRRAEDYIAGCVNYPVRIENICGATGASERSLFYAFADAVGMTPLRWLRIQKLHQARLTLKRADPLETQVTRVAMENGFSHMGHFSQNYRLLFGETPSETLRR
jgi:AraC family ethanolamine operon transcriptional activator